MLESSLDSEVLHNHSINNQFDSRHHVQSNLNKQKGYHPADSGIDLTSCSVEEEDDILDLERCDILDDDESWLVSPSAPCIDQDLLAWLRKDVDSLDPAAKRALAKKLETLLRNQRATSSFPLQSTPVHASPAKLLLLSDKDNVLLSKSFTATRPTNFLPAVSQDYVANAQSSRERQQLHPRVRKSSGSDLPPLFLDEPLSVDVPGSGSPASSLRESCSDHNGSSLREVSPKPSVTMHPELHRNIEDIQLLASVQEEELRQYLASLQLGTIGRRRKSSGEKNAQVVNGRPLGSHQKLKGRQTNDAPPLEVASTRPCSDKTRAANLQVAASPRQKQNAHANLSAPKRQLPLNQTVRLSPGYFVGPPSKCDASPDELPSGDSQQKGLRKSLPNLTSSQSSEFSAPRHISMTDSVSENGSCNDLPTATITPVSSTAGVGVSRLRQPTPRPTMPAGAKSGIPIPSSSRTPTGIPRPMSSGKARRSHTTSNGNAASVLRTTEQSVDENKTGMSGSIHAALASAAEAQNEVVDAWADGCY